MSQLAIDRAPARMPAAGLTFLEHWIGRCVEFPAAMLVVVEIVVLFLGVVSRYVFHNPIIWSDELASILFIWLAMLGSVVAFSRAEHMRMTALVAICGPEREKFFSTVALVASLV